MDVVVVVVFFFFFSSRRRHTKSSTVSWARRCVYGTVADMTPQADWGWVQGLAVRRVDPGARCSAGLPCSCPLYTSDAADDPLCVDLGGGRIIKKKKKKTTQKKQTKNKKKKKKT